jgi:hypothetical protein
LSLTLLLWPSTSSTIRLLLLLVVLLLLLLVVVVVVLLLLLRNLSLTLRNLLLLVFLPSHRIHYSGRGDIQCRINDRRDRRNLCPQFLFDSVQVMAVFNLLIDQTSACLL